MTDETVSTVPTHIALPIPAFDAITKFLGTRPYLEVAGLFTMIQANAQGITINVPPANPAPADATD